MQHHANDRTQPRVLKDHSVGGRRWLVLLPVSRTFDEPELPYVVTVRMEYVEGEVACTSVEIGQRPGGPGVGSQRIRRLPLHRLQNETLLSEATAVTTTGADGFIGGWQAGSADAGAMESLHRRRGPGGEPVPEEKLRRALAIHREATSDKRRDALKFTREQLEARYGPEYAGSRSTVHSWIQKAKELESHGER